MQNPYAEDFAYGKYVLCTNLQALKNMVLGLYGMVQSFFACVCQIIFID